MLITKKQRILVALSGGVDSSVAAMLLLEDGWDVEGVYLKLLASSRNAGGVSHEHDAMRVADFLGIHLHVLDEAERFEKEVIGRFVSEYKAGRTPNPCVWCNRQMKFKVLRELATRRQMHLIATGHYARISGDAPPMLLKGVDAGKDQAYFLSFLTMEDLSMTRFPLGELTKEEVRKFAARGGLPVADKSESQEVCFVPDDRYREFVRAQSTEEERPGQIVHTNGEVLGTHNGIADFTIGQRKGMGVSVGHPLYVVSLDVQNSRVVVGDNEDLMAGGLVCDEVNWLASPQGMDGRRLHCRIRYRHPGVFSYVRLQPDGSLAVRFETPQRAVTPGQAAVLYDGDRVMACGWIRQALATEDVD